MNLVIKSNERTLRVLFLIVIILTAKLLSVDRTVGVTKNNMDVSEGYILFTPLGVTTTYLIDNYGRIINTWESDYPSKLTVYLLENGNLMRTKSEDVDNNINGVQTFTWDNDLIWDFLVEDDNNYSHHDIKPLPNGNVLMIVTDKRPNSEYISAGRDPSLITTPLVWGEKIVEYSPTGLNTADIVWTWRTIDHLIQDFDSEQRYYGVVGDHPELIDVNYELDPGDPLLKDLYHINSIDYNEEFNQILISSRKKSEIWIIDHSTSTFIAAGHSGGNSGKGGDLLYRWGNPASYRAQLNSEREFFFQHSARWIKEGYPGYGDITVFNNGPREDGDYSSADQITPPVDSNGNYTMPLSGDSYLPVEQNWQYFSDPKTDFYSAYCSGVKRQKNGNTLISEYETGRLFEVSPDSTIVWEYIDPINAGEIAEQGSIVTPRKISNISKYSSNFPGFSNKDMTPKGYIEINPITVESTINTPKAPYDFEQVTITSKIFDASGIVSADLYVYFGTDSLILSMSDDGTGYDLSANDSVYTAVIPAMQGVSKVNYFLKITDGSAVEFNDPPFASKDYYFTYDVMSGTPVNINITRTSDSVNIAWNDIAGIDEYKVYSSDDPYSGFTEETTGTFTGTSWYINASESKKFYYVVSVK